MIGAADPDEFERLRELARERMRAIKTAQAREHQIETESARRPPPAIDVTRTLAGERQ